MGLLAHFNPLNGTEHRLQQLQTPIRELSTPLGQLQGSIDGLRDPLGD